MSEPALVSDSERLRLLDDAVGQFLMAGYQLRGRSGFEAAVESQPAAVNHVLHLLIAVFTCGLWAVVWFILAVSAPKPQIIYVTVDEWGRPCKRTSQEWQPI